MKLVDSSVWIDFFNGKMTAEADFLEDLLNREELLIGDVVLTEVLQGFRDNRDFERAYKFMRVLPLIEIVDQEIALKAAQNYRKLRAKGITIRKTIDTLIATRCINDGIELLYRDRDFDPFVEHLGLQSAIKPRLNKQVVLWGSSLSPASKYFFASSKRPRWRNEIPRKR